MNIELRKKLDEVIGRAVGFAGRHGRLIPNIVPQGTKQVPPGHKKVPHGTKKNVLFRFVRNDWKRAGLWAAVQEQLALDSLGELLKEEGNR